MITSSMLSPAQLRELTDELRGVRARLQRALADADAAARAIAEERFDAVVVGAEGAQLGRAADREGRPHGGGGRGVQPTVRVRERRRPRAGMVREVVGAGGMGEVYEAERADAVVVTRKRATVEAARTLADELHQRSVPGPSSSRSNYACADMEPLFYIPNAFSPNGVNKFFRPEGQFINFSFYEMVIFNRWGEKLFETRDFFEGWEEVPDERYDNAFKVQWELFLRHVVRDEPFPWDLLQGARGVQRASGTSPLITTATGTCGRSISS